MENVLRSTVRLLLKMNGMACGVCSGLEWSGVVTAMEQGASFLYWEIQLSSQHKTSIYISIRLFMATNRNSNNLTFVMRLYLSLLLGFCASPLVTSHLYSSGLVALWMMFFWLLFAFYSNAIFSMQFGIDSKRTNERTNRCRPIPLRLATLFFSLSLCHDKQHNWRVF